MNLIATFLKHRHFDLMSRLMGSGFSFDQAEYFLPVANDSLIHAFHQAGNCDTIEVDNVLAHINISTLARDTGIETPLISAGLQSLVQFITTKVCDEGLNDVMNHLKKIF